MELTINVNNINSQIIGRVPPDVCALLKENLSYTVSGSSFSEYSKNGLWDGTKNLYNAKSQSFPTGLLKRATSTLCSCGYNVKFNDCRKKPKLHETNLIGVELRDYQEEAINELVSKTRGLLMAATGSGKCFKYGTKILMYDGTIKNVEDIVVGDLVMGIDSKPRTVGEVHKGTEMLYKVQHTHGTSYVVTRNHILTGMLTGATHNVTAPNGKKYSKGDIVDISVDEWFKSSKTFKHVFKGFSTKVKSFNKPLGNFIIDPYVFGLWLGDGNCNSMSITTMDKEVVDTWYSLEDEDLSIRVENQPHNKSKIYHLSAKIGKSNKYLSELKRLGVYKNKHIPDVYKYSDIESRRKLLAGILDSDGYVSGNAHDIIQKSKVLADDICFLSRSLGFSVHQTTKICKCQTGASGEYNRLSITGNFENIPFKVKRRNVKQKIKYNRKHRLFGINITEDGVGKYAGFSVLEDDKHFLLGDFTVVHNSVCTAGILAKLGVRSLVIVPTTILLSQTAEVLHKILNVPIGMIGDGIRDIQDITVATFQSLTDSEDTKKSKFDSKDGRWKKVLKKQIVVREELRPYLESIDCVIVDESHHMVSDSIQRIMAACKNAYYRYGCSATPYSNRDEDVLIEAACGRVLKEITASYLIKNGWLSKPTIHLIPFKQKRGGESTTYAGLYEEKITNNPERNDLLRRIIEYRADQGDSVLVSVRYLEHGNTLYKLLVDKYGDDVVFVNSTITTKKLNDALEKLSNKEIKICIGTSLINEGVNLPSLNTLVLAGTPKSKIATMQLVGRVLRKTKDKSTVDVYDIQDYNTKYFTSASKERLNIYCCEPEFLLKEDTTFDIV